MISKKTVESDSCVCCSVGVNVRRGHEARKRTVMRGGSGYTRSESGKRNTGNGRVQDRSRGMEDSKEEEPTKECKYERA